MKMKNILLFDFLFDESFERESNLDKILVTPKRARKQSFSEEWCFLKLTSGFVAIQYCENSAIRGPK
jgi:hypothetical protein